MKIPSGLDRKTSGALSTFTIFVIMLIVMGILAAGFFFVSSPQESQEVYIVNGDTVKVDYIGMFENGKVFDTSMENIAKDNATYVKALSFEYRPTGYTPLEFVVGAGQMIKGFDEAVPGMRVGDQKTVTIPYDKGYGESDPNLVRVRDIVEELPVREVMSTAQFGARFFQDPVLGMSFPDPKWEWQVSVFDITGDQVTILNQPELNMIITPYGEWDSQVTEIDSGANGGEGLIRVVNLLEESDENNIVSTDSTGKFILIDVDLAAGTYTVDYNREVVGKTLIFYIIIVEITKPE
jgi:FKBP-type peptidyl-prolyl cis-trans isomerase 2